MGPVWRTLSCSKKAALAFALLVSVAGHAAGARSLLQPTVGDEDTGPVLAVCRNDRYSSVYEKTTRDEQAS